MVFPLFLSLSTSLPVSALPSHGLGLWGAALPTWEGRTGTLVHPEGHSDVTWGTLMFLPIATMSQKDPP